MVVGVNCPKKLYSPLPHVEVLASPLTTHWASLQCSWLKRTHFSNDIWKQLLIPNGEGSFFFLPPAPHLAWCADVECEQSFLDPGHRKMENYSEPIPCRYSATLHKYMHPLPDNTKSPLHPIIAGSR